MAQEEVKVIVKAVDEASGTFQKVGGNLDKLGEKTSNFNEKAKEIGKVMAAAGIAVGAFAIASVNKFSEVGDAIEKMSRRTGLSTESVSILRFAADQTGTSLETMEAALRGMALSMNQMSLSTEISEKTLRGFNLSIEDLQAMTPEQRFMALGEAINNIEDPTERSARAMDVFGRTGSELIPFFQEAGGNLEAFTEKASKLGLVMDEETAAKAAKLNDTMGELKAQLLGVQLQLGEALMPVVVQMNESWLPAAIEGWQNLGANLSGLGLQIKDDLVFTFETITGAAEAAMDAILKKISDVFGAWNGLLKKVTSPITTSLDAWKNLPANLGFKAEGGPVASGSPYIVGEKGPELFVPRGNGSIVPNHALAGAGGGGVNITITGNTISDAVDMERLAQRVGEEMMRVLRFNNKI